MTNLFEIFGSGTQITIPATASLLWVDLGDSFYSDNTGSFQLVIVAPTFTIAPSTLNVSTGDTNRTVTTTASPSVSFAPTFNSGSTQNPNSTCAVGLTFSQNSGTGSVSSTVIASPSGCSGIFSNVQSQVGSRTSQNSAKIVVPPQIMIQTVVSEAGGQPGDIDQQSLLVVARNRFGDGQFAQGATAWQQQLGTSDFTQSTTTNGPDRPLNNSSQVFTGDVGDIVGGGKCYWSPTNSQWSRIQTALGSGTTTFPNNTGVPGCWSTQPRQIVYKSSVGLNVSNSSQYRNAPVFVFLRLRQSTDPAVIQIP